MNEVKITLTLVVTTPLNPTEVRKRLVGNRKLLEDTATQICSDPLAGQARAKLAAFTASYNTRFGRKPENKS